MNEEQLAQLEAALDTSAEPVVVLDADGHVLISNAAARALGPPDSDRALVLHSSPPGPSAYQELRSGFTAAVSHELRTPLARLLALLESVELPDADVHELVDRARQEVEQVRELIDDVLFLGELETGRAVVGLGSTQAMPVLRAVVDELQERADAAGVRLEVRGSETLELPLRRRMLRVIAENLAGNAIRYAGRGATFTFTLAREDGTVALRAEDDGAGVTAEDLPRLFERFYRADRVRASRGTGLGLAIVKHVVTAAGGTIEARGAPRAGLAVVCRFPPG